LDGISNDFKADATYSLGETDEDVVVDVVASPNRRFLWSGPVVTAIAIDEEDTPYEDGNDSLCVEGVPVVSMVLFLLLSLATENEAKEPSEAAIPVNAGIILVGVWKEQVWRKQGDGKDETF